MCVRSVKQDRLKAVFFDFADKVNTRILLLFKQCVFSRKKLSIFAFQFNDKTAKKKNKIKTFICKDINQCSNDAKTVYCFPCFYAKPFLSIFVKRPTRA